MNLHSSGRVGDPEFKKRATELDRQERTFISCLTSEEKKARIRSRSQQFMRVTLDKQTNSSLQI